MTGPRAAGSNATAGVGLTKMAPLVTKVAEDEEMKKKMQELKRLKEKEEEAARKREELIKARAEMQKMYTETINQNIPSFYSTSVVISSSASYY